MKKKCLLFAIMPFLLLGCNSPVVEDNPQDDNDIVQPGLDDKDEEGNLDPDQGGGQQNPSDNNDHEDQTPTIEYKTIAEFKALCSNITSLNQSYIGINENVQYKIKAKAIYKFSLSKTTSKYGLDVSGPFKVIVADETGYIAAASTGGTDGTSFYGKVANYAGQDTSKYEIIGNPSIYLGNPEIFVPTRSFTFDSKLDVNTSATTYGDQVMTLTDFYSKVETIKYNCAGHGYGDVVKINNLKCIGQDGQIYTFTDGEKVIKVIKGNCSFSIGGTYNITGLISIQNWGPALIGFESSSSSATINESYMENAKEVTVNDLRNLSTSQEDTDRRYDNYSKSFQDVYKAKVYFNMYSKDNKYYVTLGDTYKPYTSMYYTQESALVTNKMIEIANPNYWNRTINELERFCDYAEDINQNNQVEIYFVKHQYRYLNKTFIPKIYILGV